MVDDLEVVARTCVVVEAGAAHHLSCQEMRGREVKYLEEAGQVLMFHQGGQYAFLKSRQCVISLFF